LISDNEAEEKARWLFDNAAEFGKLRGLRVIDEERVKMVKAALWSRAPDSCKSADARTSWALDHPEYLRAVECMGDAVEAEETARAKRVGADAIIETWRSLSANQRGRI
jgi:hypothetical protein